MAYWIGSQNDRQSRRAIGSAGISETQSAILPQLFGKDRFNPGQQLSGNPPLGLIARQALVAVFATAVGATNLLPLQNPVATLPPGVQCQDNPSAIVQTAQRHFTATVSTDQGVTWDSFPLQLIGKDAFPDGAGGANQLDWPNPSLGNVPRQSVIARTAEDDSQLNTPLPQDVGPLQQFPVGADTYDLPVPARPRAREYGQTSSFPLELIGQDQFNPGAQSFDLPPRGAARARDYTIAQSFPLELIGQDQFNPGAQSVDLPPRGVARARDYTFTGSYTLELIGQDQFPTGDQLSGNAPAGPARSRDYTWLQQFDISTLNPDQQFPVGEAVFDLPTPAPARSRDYTFDASFFHGLDGKDAMVTGDQLSGNAPQGYARASTLSDPGNNFTSLLVAALPQIPYGQSTLATDLPPRAALRARDYTIASGYTLELIGKDQFNPGQSSALSDNLPPRAASRAREYGQANGYPLELIAQDRFNPGAQLSGNAPAGPKRAVDYTYVASFPLELIGQDAVNPGAQSQDSPPRGSARSRDYTYTQSFFHGLDGQDALPSGKQLSGNAPAGPLRASTLSDPGFNQLTQLTAGAPQIGPGLSTALADLPMRGPARARDYTFTASFPLELIGKDRFNPGQQLSGNAPLGPRRAVDYTWTQSAALSVFQQLPIGQASFDLPTNAPARAREYGQTAGFFHGLDGKDRLPTGRQLSGNAPAGYLRASTLSDPGANYTANQPVFSPCGAQSFDLPPRGPARAREYGQTSGYLLELIGKDRLPTGRSTLTTEIPPRGAARARDYSIAEAFPLDLIGQDQLPAGRGTLPVELAPRAPLRLPDYTFLNQPPRNPLPFRDARVTLGSPYMRWTLEALTERWTASDPYARWTIDVPQ